MVFLFRSLAGWNRDAVVRLAITAAILHKKSSDRNLRKGSYNTTIFHTFQLESQFTCMK